MKLHGKRALVTGAGGFIGSHLTEALVRGGVATRALVHYNSRGDAGQLRLIEPEVRRAVEIVYGDVRDPTAVGRMVEGCDVVFHLAALIGIPYSYHAAHSYVETNVAGTLNVLEACRQHSVKRLVQTSTSEVYGTAQYTPIDERHPLHAQSPYAATKIGSDQLAYSFHAAFGLPVAIVRPFNTYGPRQSTRAVIPTIITQALAGDEIELGSTTPVRDFLFVGDTARGFLAAAESDRACGEVVNLGTGHGVTIGRVVELVGENLGRKLAVKPQPQRIRPEKSEVMELVCSAEKAAATIGWQAEVSLQQGLAATVDWIRTHRDRYSTDRYSI